jgi:pimeloyl-ACP methyl ester carboxylesterase
MSVVILQDQIVHYEVLGRGKPLIFLHGWVGSWRYWIPSMQAASISFRTYAIDLWGFGDTAKVTQYYSLEQQVSLLDKFLQEMGIGKIALIGHGLGAVVAMLYAAQNPKWVDRMMLVGLPNGQHTASPRLAATPPSELAEWLLSRSVDGEAVRVEAPKTDPKAIQYSFTTLQRPEVASLPHTLNTPCLMVYGQNDPALESPLGNGNNHVLPESSHQIIFEQSGHFPMLDEMSKFNRLLADFLALGSGLSPKQLQLKDEWKRRVR